MKIPAANSRLTGKPIPRCACGKAVYAEGLCYGCYQTRLTTSCAVIGCNAPGRPHTCPYDGSRHGHGRIHYDGTCPVSALEFRPDGWYLVCDAHFAVLEAERRTWSAAKDAS